MATDDIISYERVLTLAHHSAAVKKECTCGLAACAGWESIEVLFPEKQMRVLGTLLKDPDDEPTECLLRHANRRKCRPVRRRCNSKVEPCQIPRFLGELEWYPDYPYSLLFQRHFLPNRPTLVPWLRRVFSSRCLTRQRSPQFGGATRTSHPNP
jgi:hypothetical protein